LRLIELQGMPLWAVVLLFAAAAGVIAVAGISMTRIADRLADLTGLGEALFGAVLLGGCTSLSGIVTSIWTAAEGYPELSVSNALGGIAAQTAFLVVADIFYRNVNLEHAAASVENLVQAALLLTLLAIPLLAMSSPEVSLAGVHPASPLLVAAYLFGLSLVAKAKSAPLWHPYRTKETREDDEEEAAPGAPGELRRLWIRFAMLALVVAAAGFTVAQAGITLADRTGLSETIVGMLLTAIATSLPELVTSVAAVRQGALTLAVGGIIGGNSFDVLFLALADGAYREGSIYHAITSRQVFIVALTMLMTGIILLGLLRREKTGFANIGFESILVLLLYFGGVTVLFFS
jgi:cation:H+ antiporter